MPKTDLLISLPQSGPRLAASVSAGRPTVGVLLGWLAFLLYTVSFFLPAVGGILGYQAFVSAFLFVLCLPMWAANPVFWFGLNRLVQGRYRSAGKAGLLALLLALSECWMFRDELAAGYFVWVGSMAVLAATGWQAGPERRPSAGPLGAPEARLPIGEATRITSRFGEVGRRGR